MNRNELASLENDLVDAIAYDQEHGLPLCAIHVMGQIPGLIQEVQQLRTLVEKIRVGAEGRKNANKWAATVVRMIGDRRDD